jgi:molecular chaperone DnaK (HSP70)
MSEVEGAAVGIDLGTACSCVGYWRDGRVEIIANDQGNRTTPSFVAFADGERLIGDAAKSQMARNPHNTVFSAKRLIGRQFSDRTVQADAKLWPFKIVAHGEKPAIQVQHKGKTKTFLPEEISSMVLAKMKETAEAFLGVPVPNAVVTVPAYFNDAQRQATKDAGTIAGLNVLRIINEPTAAAIAYGLDKQGGERNVLIFDLGGGSMDVSLLSIEDGIFEVRATAGDTHLGGEDFDNRMVNHFTAEFKRKNRGKDPATDTRAMCRLRIACERAKRALGPSQQVSIEIDSFFEGIDFFTTCSRARFEEINIDLFHKCMEPVEKVLRDSRIPKGRVHDIVLVGGSTRIPKVQSLLEEFFNGKTPSCEINPDEAVAVGAAIQAAILAGTGGETTEDLLLLDVAPHSFGLGTHNRAEAAKLQPRATQHSPFEMTRRHPFQGPTLLQAAQQRLAWAKLKTINVDMLGSVGALILGHKHRFCPWILERGYLSGGPSMTVAPGACEPPQPEPEPEPEPEPGDDWGFGPCLAQIVGEVHEMLVEKGVEANLHGEYFQESSWQSMIADVRVLAQTISPVAHWPVGDGVIGEQVMAVTEMVTKILSSGGYCIQSIWEFFIAVIESQTEVLVHIAAVEDARVRLSATSEPDVQLAAQAEPLSCVTRHDQLANERQRVDSGVLIASLIELVITLKRRIEVMQFLAREVEERKAAIVSQAMELTKQGPAPLIEVVRRTRDVAVLMLSDHPNSIACNIERDISRTEALIRQCMTQHYLVFCVATIDTTMVKLLLEQQFCTAQPQDSQDDMNERRLNERRLNERRSDDIVATLKEFLVSSYADLKPVLESLYGTGPFRLILPRDSQLLDEIAELGLPAQFHPSQDLQEKLEQKAISIVAEDLVADDDEVVRQRGYDMLDKLHSGQALGRQGSLSQSFDQMTTLITRNTTIPTKKTQTFSTQYDNQDEVVISVYEGEGRLVRDNHLLGRFCLSGIPPAAAGVPQIEVTFDLDANSVMNVWAKDKSTHKDSQITITNDTNRLSQDDIERMVKEAEKYAAEDDAMKEKIEARNALENYAYSIRSSINDERLKDRIDAADKEVIEAAIMATTSWLDENQRAEKGEYDAKQRGLEGICDPIMMKLCQQGGEGGGMVPGGIPHNAPPIPEGQPPVVGGPTIDEVD